MNENKFNNFRRILIYKESFEWVPLRLDFSNIFLGYYPNQTYIVKSSKLISGILQKKYYTGLIDEYIKEVLG